MFVVDVPFISRLQVLSVMLNFHLLFDNHITSIVRCVTSTYSSTWRLQRLSHVPLFSRSLIIATRFSTESPNRTWIISIEFRTRWHALFVLHHTMHLHLAYEVSSLASDQAVDQPLDSDAQIQDKCSWKTSSPCRYHCWQHTILNTAFQQKGFTRRPQFRTQFAMRAFVSLLLGHGTTCQFTCCRPLLQATSENN